MEALFHKDGVIQFAAFAFITFVVGLIAIRFILIRLPANYFNECHPRTWLKDHHPVLRVVGTVLKNIVGVFLVTAGLVMLVTPGPGILAILIGVSLTDFPGKRRLERKLISLPTVLEAINKMRKKSGKPPLTISDP